MTVLEQIAAVKNSGNQIVSVKFRYDGASRIVDNITLSDDDLILSGFEMRKSGKFSYRVKKYRTDKIDMKSLSVVLPLPRSGPVIGR